MENAPKYAIDSCSLIKLYELYPYDIAPGAWDALNEMTDSGILISSSEVFIELNYQDDEVLKWAKEHQQIFFALSPIIQLKASKVLNNFPNLIDLRKPKSSADPFLIATAIVESCIIVTEELPNGPDSKFVKIPNVCKELNIRYINLLELMRLEGVKLELSKNRKKYIVQSLL